ncbi:MAG: helix-turn-helix domain-containing protein [Lachnospiraceae bacterium]
MKDRIKKIRKELDLTQQKFADRIGVKQNTVAQYEMGRNVPIDSVISLICREFNVSEVWLREGTGEMFVPRTRNQIITDFAGDLINAPEAFKTRFIEGMAKLDETDWEDIERIFLKLLDKKDG